MTDPSKEYALELIERRTFFGAAIAVLIAGRAGANPVPRPTGKSGPSGSSLCVVARLPCFSHESEEVISQCRVTPLAKVTEIGLALKEDR